MASRHVVVLAGGLTHERDVSLRSGARLTDALRHNGLEVSVRDADAELLPWLTQAKPDAAVIALHGGSGENGTVQGVLEMVGVPVTGTPARNCRLAWEKNIAKNLMQRADCHTPSWITLSHSTFRDLGAPAMIDALVNYLSLPMMIKPSRGGSALGASMVRTADEVPAALVGAFAYGENVLCEQFIDGTEVAVTVIDTDAGLQALPAVEICPTSGVFDYESRYTAGLTTYYTPARLAPDVAATVADLAVTAHRVLGLRDLSRTDAIVDAAGRAHFLEVNVSPGLTETSLLPMAVDAADLDLGSVYVELIERAMARSTSPTRETTAAAR